MATLSELQTRLSEVETAIHSAAMGERVSVVMRNGRRMEFTSANIGSLREYRDDIQRQIEKATAVAAGRPARRPINVMWPN